MRPKDVVELGRLWLKLALTDTRLRALPHAANRHLLFPESPETGSPSTRMESRIGRLVRLVSLAASYPLRFDMSCLRRSLVLRSRLLTLGFATRLVYGVRRKVDAKGVDAHVWLEAGNFRVDSTVEGPFARLSTPK